MAISFNTATDSSFTGGTSHSYTIPSHNNGDILVLVIASTRGSASPATAITTPSGWTKLGDAEAGNASAVRLTVFAKAGDGAENSVAVGLSGSPAYGSGGTVLVLPGGDSADLVDVSSTSTTQESGTDITSPSVVTTEADTLVLYCYCFDDDVTSEASVDGDAGFSGTLRGYEEIATPGNGLSVGVSTKTQAGIGATGACDWNTSDNDAGVAFTIAFRSGVVGPTITDVETDEDFDDKDTGVTITGTTFEATKGTGKVELADSATYASANKIEQTTTSWGATAIDFTADLGTQSPGTKYIFVTNDSAQRSDGFAVTVHRANAFTMSASANIAASGANTTAQLTAPSGKTTGDFDAGRIQDDENPADSVNITADDYTEMEWSIEAGTDAREVAYRFRVTDNGTALDTYTVNPQLTISASGQTVNLGLASETDSGFAIAGTKDAAVGLPNVSDAALAVVAGRAVAVGLSTSAETAQSLAISRSVVVGLAAEAANAQALVLARNVDVGQASASEGGFAVGVLRSNDIGLANEAASALAVVGDKRRAIGQAADAETAFFLGRAKLVSAGSGVEADIAFDIAPIRGLSVSTVSDSSTAFAIAVLKQRALGLATSSEQAFAATAQKGGAPPAANDDYLMRRRRRRAS